MTRQSIHRATTFGVVGLSALAFLTVLTGFLQPPQPDEGAGAHIFQLTVMVFVPVILLFLATADWTRPRHSARPLLISGTMLILAFGALYCLEHYR